MKPDTFDDPLKYPAIRYITHRIDNEKNSNRKRHLAKFITEFNTVLKEITLLNTTLFFKKHIIRLIKDEYIGKIDDMIFQYHDTIELDKNLYSHLKNYVLAKLRNLERAAENDEIIFRKSIKQTKINLDIK